MRAARSALESGRAESPFRAGRALPPITGRKPLSESCQSRYRVAAHSIPDLGTTGMTPEPFAGRQPNRRLPALCITLREPISDLPRQEKLKDLDLHPAVANAPVSGNPELPGRQTAGRLYLGSCHFRGHTVWFPDIINIAQSDVS